MRLGGLNRHLHRIFDLTPDPVLALRVNAGETGLGWKIAGDTLTLTSDGGAPQSFDLAAHTISSLGSACAAAGFTVLAINTDLARRSAICLLPGAGHSLTTNGDHLLATQNLTLLLLDALGEGVELAREDLLDALAQMWPLQAEEKWADYWGQIFGVWRRDNEEDGAYTARIFAEVVRPRSNRYALEAKLGEELGVSVSVLEPWQKVLHASGYAPTLSAHRLRDRWFWTHGTIEIRGAERDAASPLVERFRAGGVLPRYRKVVSCGALDASATIAGRWARKWGPAVGGGRTQWWLDGYLPRGDLDTFGVEPWDFALVNGVRAHRSFRCAGYDHEHGVTGLPGRACPADGRLVAWVRLDPDSPPETLLLGWRFDGEWVYAFWGDDTRTETPRYDQGGLPMAGAWIELRVDPVALDVDPGATCDGMLFAWHGGGGDFGPAGVIQPSAWQTTGWFSWALTAGPRRYEIDGEPVLDLYTRYGEYHAALEFSSEFASVLHRLESPGDGPVFQVALSGSGWRLGDLVALGYDAGHAMVAMTPAEYQLATLLPMEITQVS